MTTYNEFKAMLENKLSTWDDYQSVNEKRLSGLKASLEKMDSAIDVFQGSYKDHAARLEDRIDQLEARASLPAGGGMTSRETAEWRSFEKFVRLGDKSELRAPEGKEMSIVGGAAAGQAMVPEQIASQIINRALAASPIATFVRSTNVTTSDYVRLVNLRGATAAWSSETGTRTATATPSLREVRPTHGELYSFPSVTNWLLQDSQFNVANFLRENVSAEFGKSLETAILSGDGSNKPTGMLNTTPVNTDDNASPQRAADAIEFVAGSADLADDILTLLFTLKPEYRRNARFMMSSAALAQVRKLRDANGSGFLWQANLGAAVDFTDGLLAGKPVGVHEGLPITGQSPVQDAILCGDFDVGYELVRIGGMMIIRDDVTTPGKTKFYINQRFGGRLTDNDAIKVLRA